MGLYNALAVGVNGVQAQSGKIDVISTNISNSNTVGYKSGIATFADLISGDSPVGYSPNGAQTIHTKRNEKQGEITPTNSGTDLAISGDGYFAVAQDATNSTGQVFYTRAGSFTPDKNDNLVNGAGFYLQAWPIDDNGNLPGGVTGNGVGSGAAIGALQPVNVKASVMDPVATTRVSPKVNLNPSQVAYSGTPAYDATLATANMASGAVTPQFRALATIVDADGVSHDFNIGFLKTGTNSWAVEAYAQPASDIVGGNAQVASGTISFNGDGTLASVSPSLTQPVAIAWQNGAAASDVTFNWGTAGPVFGTPGATVTGSGDGLSQIGSDYSFDSAIQNGYKAGTLTSMEITADGFVVGTYSNGNTRNLYQIPLVRFTNGDQLQNLTGNVFTQSLDSGAALFSAPGTEGTGKLDTNALESSNVDLGTQLTDMIVAQRSYQFNTKLVSTADTMLQTLTQMIGT